MPTDPLRAAGLRRTPARLAVLAQIEQQARPLAHAELLALPDLAQLDDITLYRTLAALVEAGLAHRVLGTDGVWRYGAPPGGHPGCPGNHAHFFCSACRAMACLPDQPIPRITLPPGAAVDGRHLLVFGRCAPCVAAGSAP
jgi:Fur family ferric uptake transcriptional regulator/Fur family zinc uptake transcriptional regulator